MLIRDRDFWLPRSDATFPEERSQGGNPGVYGLNSDHIAAKRLGVHQIPFSKRLS